MIPCCNLLQVGMLAAGAGKWRCKQPSIGAHESAGAGVPLSVSRGGCCQPTGVLHFSFIEDGCSVAHSCSAGPWPGVLGTHCCKFHMPASVVAIMGAKVKWDLFAIDSNTEVWESRFSATMAVFGDAALGNAQLAGCCSFSVASCLCISMVVELIHAELMRAHITCVSFSYNTAHQVVVLAADSVMDCS